MQLKVQKLDPSAKLPAYAHVGDAGLDLYALEQTTFKPMERKVVRTGIALQIPEEHVGLIWDKSGISIRKGITTIGGVFDSGYRGELLIGMINVGDTDYTFEKGDKFTQILIQKVESCEVVESQTLSNSSRGEGNFGSTGK